MRRDFEWLRRIWCGHWELVWRSHYTGTSIEITRWTRRVGYHYRPYDNRIVAGILWG